jgi:hypothetical protein
MGPGTQILDLPSRSSQGSSRYNLDMSEQLLKEKLLNSNTEVRFDYNEMTIPNL